MTGKQLVEEIQKGYGWEDMEVEVYVPNTSIFPVEFVSFGYACEFEEHRHKKCNRVITIGTKAPEVSNG